MLLVQIIVAEGEPTVDQPAVVRREVPLDLEIGFCVKKNVIACPIMTGRSKGNSLYNLY